MSKLNLFASLKRYHKPILVLAVPLLASLVLLASSTKPAKCAFVVLVMSLYWTTECIPIGITSLLPIFLFPVFDIVSSKVITRAYFQDITMLLFAALIVASSIESSGLHERIALKFLLLFGSNPKWILLGFMLITAFISMWISNTATCSMMIPLIIAVVRQLVINDQMNQREASEDTEQSNQDDLADDVIKKTERGRHIATCFLLSCSYSATLGGLGSLVGTAPNVLIKGFFDEHYPAVGLSFLNFSLFALPVSMIMIFLAWIWLTFKWLPKEYSFQLFERVKPVQRKQNDLNQMLRDKYKRLGPTTFEQKCVAIIFVSLVVLWVTRDVQGVFGWGLLFKSKKFLTDTTPAILAVMVLFACPKNNIFIGEKYQHLIDWKKLQEKYAWNIVLLLGGGLALADGFKMSGLSEFIGESLTSVMSGSKEVTLLCIIIVSAVMTEFTSNASIASIFLPIANSIAIELNLSPIYFLMPIILAVSLAFMLPIATPTNALVFVNGYVKMRDMILTGLLMNILGLAVVFLAANTWLGIIFDLKPHLALSVALNSTSRLN